MPRNLVSGGLGNSKIFLRRGERYVDELKEMKAEITDASASLIDISYGRSHMESFQFIHFKKIQNLQFLVCSGGTSE